jgi:hypothetical protein
VRVSYNGRRVAAVQAEQQEAANVTCPACRQVVPRPHGQSRRQAAGRLPVAHCSGTRVWEAQSFVLPKLVVAAEFEPEWRGEK